MYTTVRFKILLNRRRRRRVRVHLPNTAIEVHRDIIIIRGDPVPVRRTRSRFSGSTRARARLIISLRYSPTYANLRQRPVVRYIRTPVPTASSLKLFTVITRERLPGEKAVRLGKKPDGPAVVLGGRDVGMVDRSGLLCTQRYYLLSTKNDSGQSIVGRHFLSSPRLG